MNSSSRDSTAGLTETPGGVRAAAVAGQFYPGGRTELHAMVTAMLDAAGTAGPAPKALIVPHAGYVYSGSVAASAYALLREARTRIRRVVLLGPAHRVYLRGVALPSARAFRTPLGDVPLDSAALDRLRPLPGVSTLDAAHAGEHSLEVHLPFLQLLLDDFRLLPMVVGDADPDTVAGLLGRLWGGDETLIVISSDLSHYHDYVTARRLDSATADAIVDLRFEELEPEQACGCMPLRGLLSLARERDLEVTLLDLRNSGDTAGPRDRVVGYGAFAVRPRNGCAPALADTLLRAARAAVEAGLRNEPPPAMETAALPEPLRAPGAVFVTLERHGRLRGCMGVTEAAAPLIDAVTESAFNAAFRDPRFEPLGAEELADVAVKISILGPPRAIAFRSEEQLLAAVRPGLDGLIIEQAGRRALFLPEVWETLPDPAAFLAQLKTKGEMDPDRPPERAWRFSVASLSES